MTVKLHPYLLSRTGFYGQRACSEAEWGSHPVVPARFMVRNYQGSAPTSGSTSFLGVSHTPTCHNRSERDPFTGYGRVQPNLYINSPSIAPYFGISSLGGGVSEGPARGP